MKGNSPINAKKENQMEIVVETFLNPKESSRSLIRVRPVPGQGISTSVRIECSKSMRDSCTVGQMFLLTVKWKNNDPSKNCLYSSYHHTDTWEKVTAEEAKKFINRQFVD